MQRSRGRPASLPRFRGNCSPLPQKSNFYLGEYSETIHDNGFIFSFSVNVCGEAFHARPRCEGAGDGTTTYVQMEQESGPQNQTAGRLLLH